ncbi:Uma2 family endonuclease [Rhodopseudomonas sp. NSM]|uniref:Uma2 family endonuclease n=1 Tax=Rhodopseudomonas sp. NSM TaxID=3457630 RepID=UPI00403595BC
MKGPSLSFRASGGCESRSFVLSLIARPSRLIRQEPLMGIAIPDTSTGRMSGAEFRTFQAHRPDHERWELLAGVPMMMTPPTIVHNWIATNLANLLNTSLARHDSYRIALQRTGIELGSGDYRPEPDVVVIDADFAAGQRFVTRAYLLAEIVSESDDVTVSGMPDSWIEVKRQIYLAHAPCEAVLIVQQNRIEARLDIKTGNGWDSMILGGIEAELRLPQFGLGCRLGDLYDGTPLRPRARRT